MINPWKSRAVVLAVSALGLAACSSTQPDSISTRNGSLTFETRGVLGKLNCYEIWQDTTNPQDGIPDVYLDQKQCFETTGTENRPLPWHYSIIVTIIRSGTTFEDLLFSVDGVPGTTSVPEFGLPEYFSLTGYDLSQPPAPARDPVGDIYFVNGKDVTWGSAIYQTSFSASCPSCPMEVGTPNVAGGPESFNFTLNSGDTVLVRARKQTIAQSPGYVPADADAKITLNAQLSMGGVPVATNGATATSDADGSTLSFSYTVK